MSKKLDQETVETFRMLLEMTKALEKKEIIKDDDLETSVELEEWSKTL
jgi:hypothetical protein